MVLDPGVQTLLASLEGQPPLHEIGVEQARQGIELFAALGGPGPDLPRVEDRTVPGPACEIPVRLYVPAGDGRLPVVVYFHGGGWVIGNIASHDPICRQLADASGCALVSVEYRLAPEHGFPAAADDCHAAAAWVGDHGEELGVDSTRMAVAGDSAGGNLAAVTALRARDRGGPPLLFHLLLYPVVDGTMSFPSYKENADGYLMTAADMAWFYDLYVGSGTDRKDPDLSPLYAPDLAALPPALVLTAEYDVLRDEGEAYADALQQAGVTARASRYDGLVHGFFGLGAVFLSAAPAMEEAAAALRQALRPS